MKVAAVQMDVALGQVEQNLESMLAHLGKTARAGAGLTVFPECALTGYCFSSLEEARPHAQSIPGPATERMSRACAETDTHAVFGLLESDGDRIFNAAVLVGPEGVVASYRKVHIPFLGIDCFVDPGDRPFAVHDLGEIRVGINICYDVSFPEAARSLALQGADLVVLPTNWPPGAECLARNVINARAMENVLYYLAANRVGTERGFRFIGRSQVCGPDGETIAMASESSEEILYAEVDPARARRKHIVRVPGRHEIDRMADRRPEMYEILGRPHELRTPHQRHGTLPTGKRAVGSS